ncbi:MAG TPA: SpoIIE family protein phosphatase [Bryobacteraceae bacterium]|nr:SpoIIE family protein phosphatase [Bryobacteraceae bacterium]
MSAPRSILKSLGRSGIAFLIGLILFIIFTLTGHDGLASLVVICMIVPGFILTFRAFVWVKQHSLWSLRNRLLVVYALMGVLPVALLFVLIGVSAWALMSELALYLAGSALDHRLADLQNSVHRLQSIPQNEWSMAVSHFAEATQNEFPGAAFYFKDQTGEHRYPANSAPVEIPPGWGDSHGLLVWKRHFYGWAHAQLGNGEIAVLAPLSNQMIENLVPNLGAIGMFETETDKNNTAAVGAVTAREKAPGDVDFGFDVSGKNRTDNLQPHVPPAMGRFDIPVIMPATRNHFHLETPGKTYTAVIVVWSRPSAVLRTLFSGSEDIRGWLYDTVIAVAVLFLFVELIAMWIGVRLSRRIMGAVNQLYNGTRNVIHGDFHSRISVREKDQLGELALSFNQMTENLERLLVVEKEKERLQTELEIAREVQAQLYPKAAPPFGGLKLTVRCDPARMVSGDYYDYQEIGKGKLAFAIGDVAGKGISAALLMATLQAALRAQITSYQPVENVCDGDRTLDAATLVSALNKQIYAHTSPEKYATFFFALFDEQTRRLSYTNAGHLSPLLFRNEQVTPLDSNGTVVGAFPWAQYDESCLTMDPGDLLVCYTDGITEPENAFGEMFGEERLIELVQKYRNREDSEIVAIVLDTVRSWTGSPELHDDMTLLLAREVQTA